MPKRQQRDKFDPKSFLAKIGAGKTIAYGEDETIFSQGDEANDVLYLQHGKAKLAVVSTAGKEGILAILTDGEFFGEGCLIGEPRRMATVTAISDCAVLRIDKATMLRALHDEPEFASLFITHLLHRTGRTEANLIDQLFNSSEKRLARTLLLLANFGKESKSERVMAKISQSMLAEMIGTTRSRVSFFMNKFRRLGFIDYNGGLHVHSSLLNVVLHDER